MYKPFSLHGPPGVGKSSVIDELCALLSEVNQSTFFCLDAEEYWGSDWKEKSEDDVYQAIRWPHYDKEDDHIMIIGAGAFTPEFLRSKNFKPILLNLSQDDLEARLAKRSAERGESVESHQIKDWHDGHQWSGIIDASGDLKDTINAVAKFVIANLEAY